MAKLHSAEVAGGGVELKSAVVSGAGADTNISVTGLSWAKDPRFIACVQLNIAADTGTDATGNKVDNAASLLTEVKRGTTDSTLQLETTVTTGDKLLLVWAQKA